MKAIGKVPNQTAWYFNSTEYPYQFLIFTCNRDLENILRLSVKQSSLMSEFSGNEPECNRILNLRNTDILLCLIYSSSTCTYSCSFVTSRELLCRILRRAFTTLELWQARRTKELLLGDHSLALCIEETQIIQTSISFHLTSGTLSDVHYKEHWNKIKTSVKGSEKAVGENDKEKKDYVCGYELTGSKSKKCLQKTSKYEGKLASYGKRNLGVWRKGITFFCLILLFFEAVNPQSILYCPATKDTANGVPSCPLNMSELDKAIRRKNCSSFVQNCTSPDLFVYHCLPNHYLNRFVEVCGVAVDIIYGHCAEYNEGGGVIQENYQTDCTKFSKPCPIESYSSVDTYKYVDCFNITPSEIPDTTEYNGTEEPIPKNITESPTSNESSPNFGHKLRRSLAIVFGVVIPLLSLTLIILTYTWTHRKKNTKKTYDPIRLSAPGEAENNPET